jgi:ribosomal protein S18
MDQERIQRRRREREAGSKDLRLLARWLEERARITGRPRTGVPARLSTGRELDARRRVTDWLSP